MSDRVGLKPKDNAAKKFSSLNLSQTYKGTKVEPKASTGIQRHGLQSLGKVAASRRMPPPANLPSLKSENLGNDPTVALVPSGGGGWGSAKEKEATTTTSTNKNTTQGPATAAQPQSQQPSKPTETSQKATTGQQISTGQTTSTNQSSATTKTWASSSSSVAGGQERTSYPHQSQYFNQEFPTLGGGNSKDKLPDERTSHQPYGQPQRNTHEPPWMDKGGSGPPPPKPSFGMYNGVPYPGPPQRAGYGQQMYNRDGHPMNSSARPEGNENFPYMGASRPPNYAAHPAVQRGHPGSRASGPMPPKHMIKLEDSPSGYVRPSIVNEEDIRAMDSEDMDDDGWAGQQEEIDYSIKLNFDDDEPPSPVGNNVGQSDRQNKPAGTVREAPQQRDRVVNGDFNRAQVDSKRPTEPRQAWAISADGRDNFQPQWGDPNKQGHYNAQGQYNAQRGWSHHYPSMQQRNAFPMGPQHAPPNTSGGRPHPQDQSRTGSTGADKSAIEKARQRKLHEEEERKRQQESASREKLRLLDEKTRPVQIQTHEASVREQAGPRSPVSPAGSDAPIRRIMRRKDSGSVGDDDGSSVKSVESVGREEMKSIPESKNQTNKPLELRKTSSSELQEERKSPALKGSEEERKAQETAKDKVERKSSLVKYSKETTVEKPKSDRDPQRVESSRQKREEDKVIPKVLPSVDVRDSKKHIKEQEKRPERKSSESRPRSDEAFRKKSQHETDESRENNKIDYGSRKENFANRGNRLGSKNERGSSESVRSRESIEKRKDDRRPEDIKRKREDFEQNEPLNEQENRDRVQNRDRFYNSRGRAPLGGKSHLRGHPKSYSHSRADRTATQRRNRTRNDSKDYADDEKKTVATEEKDQANEKPGERRWADGDKRKADASRPQPSNDRKRTDDGRRQPDEDRQQTEASKRPQDNDRRPQDNDRRPQPDNHRRQPNTEKSHRDENGRRHEKRENEEGRQPFGDNRRKDYQDSRFYSVDKRNERGTREDKSYKGSGRVSQKYPVDRCERFRDKSKNKGGFGLPPAKEQTKKSESEEKFKDENESAKTKPIPSTTDPKKSDERGTDSLNKDTANKNSYSPPVTNDSLVSESIDVAKEVKNEDHLDSTQKTPSESNPEKPATKDTSSDKKPNEKAVTERQSSLVSDGKKQHDNKESKTATSGQSKTNQQVSRTGERRERPLSNREQQYKTNRNFSKSDFGDSKVDKRREPETYRDNRQKQDSKFHDKRAYPREDTRREQTKRSNERKATVDSSGDKLDQEQYPKEKERKDRQGSDPRFEGRRNQKEYRDGTRQSDRTQERGERVDRRDNSSYRDRKEQGDQEKSEQRSRSEYNRPDPRDRTEQRERSGRYDRSEQRERTDRRDRTKQREQTDYRDMTEPQTESKNETLKSNDDTRRKPNDNGEEKGKDIPQNVTVPDKEGANRTSKENEKSTKPSDDLSSTKRQADRFNVGYMSPRADRRPYSDSRRGAPSSRRGARGGARGMRGRGRGRPVASGRHVGKGSVASKDDDENDSENFHSADSSFTSGSDESDVEDVFPENDRQKDDRRPTRSYSSGGRTKQSYSSRGRGRGNSQLPRNPRKLPEKPPRFQKQEQARSAGRGRGKGTRGGFTVKENWVDTISKNKDGRTSDEGPSPKKRPPDSSFANEKGSDGGVRGQKSSRGGHSGNTSSFLAKKQQEVVEGSSKKGGARFGAKSTVPAALTTHGRNERRAKNEPSSADVDENLEPPKKNPRRTEPPKTGIEHIDMSNIASFIDIDDIVHPANEVEPSSPQTDFVEVKSKRTQKELREKQREEEERKRRETEKMMQDALLKPKSNKPTSMNKQHTASKPPRFARNAGVPSNAISTLPGGNTPPRGDTPVVSPENSTITALSTGNVEQKRTSPLIMEKPSSPPPPPIFNAWTKPLSITPAKPPNEASVELPRTVHPDPLAVGSGKPQRASGTQLKAEEPELQIQLTLPDTFQAIPTERDIDSQNTESRMFPRVEETESGERRRANANGSLKKTNGETTAEQTESKKPDRVQSIGSHTQRADKTHNVKTADAGVNTDKNSSVETDKRQSSGNNWKSDRIPRFEKSVTAKNKSDSRKLKTDTREVNGEKKSQPVLVDATKASNEKNDGRPRSTSRPRDVNKPQKPKPQVKTAQSQTVDENGEETTESNSRDKTENEEHKESLNKRDSVELDVQSMSESLLDETTLRMVETSKAGTGTTSMVKIKTEDDIKMDYEMQEKMVAAKKAWDFSVSSSTSIQAPQWKASATDDKTSESTEVDHIPRRSPEAEESAEPLGTVTTPRLKKSSASEQQNVCKVKPQQQQQQQQQPVKPQTVPSNEVAEEYASSKAIQRQALESETQTGYPIQAHQTTFASAKPATQGYVYSFEQQSLIPITHQYVQTDVASIPRHVSPVRQQTLHAASQSPPQRAATYPQGQPVSTPSPLSHQPLIHDTYRPLLAHTALYSTNAFAGNQYFPMSVVRPAAPPPFQSAINEDTSNSMYTAQAAKPQNPSHGYDTAVPTAQQMFLPVEQQQQYSDYMQPRQHTVGFYSDTTNHANLGGLPAHVQKTIAFSQNDKQVQPQHNRDSRTPTGRHEQQQVYNTSVSESEMSKHVHAKPFQPPSSSPSSGVAHQIPLPVRQIPPGPSNVSPAYHVNNAVLSMQATGAPALQISVSSSDHTGTTPIVTQAHALPVSRLSFHQFPSAVGSIPRQMQVPVQQLAAPTYPATLTYRAPVASYPTTTSIANQTGVLVHKPAPVMRQLVTAGRGAPVPHRMPEPIQRPSKSTYHASSLKEKQLNPQQRLKSTLQMTNRRAFHPVGVAQAQMAAAYQLQTFPGQQQPNQTQQQQQQQMFRSQQHQQMLSNAQQFFAEDKEMENQRKQKQKKRATRQQTPERRGVRTAQIPPQGRPQHRPKPSVPKQEPEKIIQQLSNKADQPKAEIDSTTSLVQT